MRIAICDDEEVFRTHLRETMVRSGLLARDDAICEYPDGGSLIAAHMEKPFDILFLDIRMDGLSGLETGRDIRKHDKDAIIIFITSFEQYVLQTFKIEAFDFILKPADDKAVGEVLQRALRKHKEQRHIINFKWQGASFALEVSRVIYAEGSSRHITFVTSEKNFECIGKLADYERMLAEYGFIRCHQGYLMNMRYIRSIESNCIVTKHNHTVPMSARKRAECLKAFNMFLNRYKV